MRKTLLAVAILLGLGACDTLTEPESTGWVAADHGLYPVGGMVTLTLRSQFQLNELVLLSCSPGSVWVQKRVNDRWVETEGIANACAASEATPITVPPEGSFSRAFEFDRTGTFRFGFRVKVQPYEDHLHEIWYSQAVQFH